ncbi:MULTISPECIES: DUF6895 family protein [Streptomyces]|uniref:DUF6895 family protein n=1 Tax=Streptomyces TaxID=1883 RepID=UPI0009903666|nr:MULTISPECIES: hypothetical protein [unclassified Streptomyces]AQT72958.1 hypothetical protein B1K54_16000 [Streptomyces sp. fd1-xmd]MDX6761354.1 hypothetical protein [Streptomyces sp. F8]
MASWCPIDLAATLAGWVDRELEQFTPWIKPGVTTSKSLQRFAELAILYDVLDRSPLDFDVLNDRWRPFLEQHLADPAFGQLARTRLEWAWDLLLPYLILRQRGLRSDYHEATLAHATKAGFPHAAEVIPYRKLDHAYFARATGTVDVPQAAFDELLGRTFAARSACRLLLDREATYALTHALLYAGAFGQERVPRDALPNVAAIVDSMTIDCAVQEEYDMLGELLTCGLVLEDCRPDVRALALPIFLQSLDATGSLMPNGRETERSFAACYHTTLVGLILCASLTRMTS